MNILSLFDGMSCGQIALNKLGIPVTNYFASEIDKYAIEIAKKNYPSTIHLGDVTQVKGDNLPQIDLLIGGSPCQGFSFAGKQLNFDDPRSKLFFEFVRLLKETKPKYFLLENVKMKKEYQDVISEHLGIEPVEINSALVSAQNRKRLYWTNIPNVTQPEDKGIRLRDVLEDGDVDRDKSLCLDANYHKGGNLKQYFEKHRRQLVFNDVKCGAFRGRYLVDGKRHNSQQDRAYYSDKKHGCLGASRLESKTKVMVDELHYRKLTPIECERLQTVPDNATKYGLDCRLQILKLGNDCYENKKCKNVELKNVINPSQAGKLNSAINTTLDSLEMELQSYLENLLIKAKNVHQKDVQEKVKQLSVSVSSIIKDGSVSSHQKTKEIVQFAIKKSNNLDGVECVLDTLHHNQDTATHSELMKMTHENTSHTETKEKDTISQMMVDGFIELSLKKLSEENSKKVKSYIILTLINLIIAKAIFMYAKTTSITNLSITSLNHWRGNLLEMDLLNLKTESTVEMSNSVRYKALGNGWTVDVIAHIFRGLK